MRTAKALADGGSATRVVDEARALCAELLIVRCPAADLYAAQTLEEQGCRLMDVLVYYARDLRLPIPEESDGIRIRPANDGEEEPVAEIARAAFAGYFGHYHADRRLDPKKADEVYVSWARRSCLSRDVAAEVLVADDGGLLRGFLTLRRNSAEESEIVLNAVAPAAQRRGIYRALMINALRWSVAEGAARAVVSTQLTNVAVQKAWTRLGFEPHASYLTFHRWFDE